MECRSVSTTPHVGVRKCGQIAGQLPQQRAQRIGFGMLHVGDNQFGSAVFRSVSCIMRQYDLMDEMLHSRSGTPTGTTCWGIRLTHGMQVGCCNDCMSLMLTKACLLRSDYAGSKSTQRLWCLMCGCRLVSAWILRQHQSGPTCDISCHCSLPVLASLSGTCCTYAIAIILLLVLACPMQCSRPMHAAGPCTCAVL